ncbi:hypothetical protein CEP51_006585 [Fusarium floridanum]|uniref:Uncharacterized protein n=1 Tax=Fusarium floridanum TaxID=1325733 RepID=A0A428RS89_9HYPO|nr:hypothetical protein CEP51_006585 [Fusarium floridanum]
MFTEMMTRVLDSQERTEVRITETQAQMALQLSSLKATCHPSAQQTSLSRTPRDVTTEPSRFKSPTRASSSSPEPSTTDIPDEIFAQVKARTEEWRWKEPLATQNWTFRTKAGAQDADDREGRLEGSLSLTSKKNLWKARALFKARINILGRRIIFLEIEAQQFTQTWFGMPFLSSQLSIVNVRPNDAPIFKACVDFNLPMVKHLLETGEASIHDVDEDGNGLLEFLLEQGCNPNVFHGDGFPAVLRAFERGLDHILSLLMFHGAQLEGFARHPVTALGSSDFFKQVKFLRSVGFSDWNPDQTPNYFLDGAVGAGDIAELLFGLEEVKLDPNAQEPYHSDDGSEYDSFVNTESWSGEEDGFTYEESDSNEEKPFKSMTLFYETISTEKGRRQLARFPLVRLLVNALQLAGYRTDLDDDGDIWYDNEDGDRYFDAREYQPSEGEDDGVVANCPICQDPEKYGLGHIFAEAERAREFLREYRRRKAEEKGRQRW